MKFTVFFSVVFVTILSVNVFSQKVNDSIPIAEQDQIDENIDEDNQNDSTLKETIVMAYDSLAVPAAHLYPGWNNSTVNPYQIDLTKKTDTTLLILNNFTIPVTGHITSCFGFRHWRWHYGTDLKLQVGDSVHCSFNGMVRIARRSRSFGNYVVIRHHNGLETIYGHLSKILVNINQPIKAGDVLGLGGNTGRSTGPHLHYEVRFLGNSLNPTDIINIPEGKLFKDTLLVCQKNFDYIKEIRKIRYYVVRKGDTLGRIASKNGVSVAQICRLNNLRRTSILRVGRRIRFS